MLYSAKLHLFVERALDVAVVAKCFGSYPGCPPPLIWNVNCDITGLTFGVPDGKVNILDVSLVARHFGELHE
jgi:hypothetical protein